jgi:UDP-glucose 4-epimerase
MTMQSNGKMAVVTGGAGFIGSHLCERLVKEGWDVISVDNYFAGSRDNHIPGVEYREGHTKGILSLVPETPDIIFHLGEYSRVEQSVLEPGIVHDLNTIGTQGVIEFWQIRRCKLVYAGSSTKFGDGGATRTTSPYASTKAENSEKIREVGEAEHLPYAITYFYNVYGPGERAGIYGTVIEGFKQMYLQGAPLAVTAPGTQTRNFTHVDDIVDGLLLVAQKGHGDEYGLGNERSYSILEVANLFTNDVVMLPERAASRTQSSLDTSKARSLGWAPQRLLEEYIQGIVSSRAPVPRREKRVLVFSTTFFPVEGPAEKALYGLIEKLPAITFDIVTSSLTLEKQTAGLTNAAVHHVGFGRSLDKYLLPWLGYRRALKLQREHSYLFSWALMASYGALAGVLLKRKSGMPLLVTLADQNIRMRNPLTRAALKFILNGADQVYGTGTSLVRRSLGVADAFANQVRYAYAELLEKAK